MPSDESRPEETSPPAHPPSGDPAPPAPKDTLLADLERQLAALLQGQEEVLQNQRRLTARIYALEQHSNIDAPAAVQAAKIQPSGLPPHGDQEQGTRHPDSTPAYAAPPPLPRASAPPSSRTAGFPPLPAQSLQAGAPPRTVGPTSPAAGKPEGIEETVGANWMNRIAVVTLIFGAGFLFKYGVDNNWLGPAARVVLGILCGLIALGSAEALYRRDLRVFAQGITGLGLALFYLSFWAAAQLYELIPLSVAFLAMSVTTAIAGPLALRYGAQAVALLGLIGGYLTPVVLSSGESHPWVLFSYLFLLNTGGLIVARQKHWISIEAVSVFATSIYFLGQSSDETVIAAPLLGALFGVALYAQFWLMHPGVWAVAQLAFPAAVAIQWGSETPALAWQIPFALAGLGAAHFRKLALAPPWTLLTAALITAVWVTDTAFDQEIPLRFVLLTLLFLPFLAWAPWQARFQKQSLTSPDLTIFAGFGAAYFGIAYELLEPLETEFRGALALAVAGLYLAASRLLAESPAVDTDNPPSAGLEMTVFKPQDFALALACTFLTLAIPIQFAGFRVTMAWALEAAGLAWVGRRYRQWALSGIGFLVLALTSAHIFADDAWMYDGGEDYATLLNLRMLTIACGAAAAWMCAYLHASSPAGFPKSFSKGIAANPLRPLALLEYLDGHGLLLLGLALETIGWVDRNFTLNVTSVTTLSLSIVFTVYAALWIGIGVQTRQRIHRIVGLALIALMILKLYLYDVWILGRLFRILAFLALGVILLAVSYLYSRYRHVLERLWDPATGTTASNTTAAEPE